jgi:hypothetical protein
MGKAVAAGGAYFTLVFLAGFLLGIVRTLLVTPAMGEMLAVVIELPVILALAWYVCRRVIVRFKVRRQFAAGATMGMTAFVLLMAGEASLSMLLAGRSLSEHLQLFGETAHLLGLAGQIAFALFPMLQLLAQNRQVSK